MPLEDLVTQPINKQQFLENPEEYKYNSLVDELRAVNQRGDRQETSAWIDALHADPAMEGLSKKDVGELINKKLGGQEKAGFDRFRSATRYAEALGYNVMEGGRTYGGGQYTGAAMEGLAGMFTDDQARLAQWRNAGEYIPGGLALLGTSFLTIPMGTVAGLGAMSALTYGAGTESARARGVGGWTAPLAGAIDAGVNLMFVKAGPAMGGKIADTLTAKSGAAKAIMDMSKEAGESLYENAVKAGMLTSAQKTGITIASHAITDLTMAAGGVAAGAGKEAMLYANEPGREQWLSDWWDEVGANPDYWMTSMVTEAGFSLVGHVIGRNLNARLAKERAAIRENVPASDTFNTNVDIDPGVAAALKRQEVEAAAAGAARPVNETKFVDKSVGSFTTSRGSVYTQFEDGTTRRNQVAVPEEGITGGTMIQSRATGYFAPDVAEQVKNLNFGEGNPRFVVNEDGTLTINKIVDGKVAETLMENVPMMNEPQVGLRPVEFRQPEDRADVAQGFKGRYIGTPIVEINGQRVEIDPTLPRESVVNPTEAPPMAPEMAQLLHAQNNDTSAAAAEVAKRAAATEAGLDANGEVVNPPITPIVVNPDQAVLLAGNAHDANTGAESNTSPVQDAFNGASVAKNPSEADAAIRKVVVNSMKVFDNLPVTEPGIKVLAATSNRLTLQHSDGATLNLDADFFNAPFDPIKFASQFNHTEQDAILAKQFHDDYQNTINKYRESGNRLHYDDETLTTEKRNSWTEFAMNSGIHDALIKTNGVLVLVDSNNTKSWIHAMMTKSNANANLIPDVNGPMFFINGDKSRQGYLHEVGHIVDHLIRIDGFDTETRLQWESLIDQVYNNQDMQKEFGVSKMIDEVLGDESPGVKQINDYMRTKVELAANAFQAYMLNEPHRPGIPSKFKSFMETNFPLIDAIITKMTNAFRQLKRFVRNPDNLTIREQFIDDNFMPGGRETRQFFDQLFGSTRVKPDEFYTNFNERIKNKLDPVSYEKVLETFHTVPPAMQTTLVSLIDKSIARGDSQAVIESQLPPMLRAFNSVKRTVDAPSLERLFFNRVERTGDKGGPLMMAPQDTWSDWPNAKVLFNHGRNHRAMIALQMAVSDHALKVTYEAYENQSSSAVMQKGAMDQMKLLDTLKEVDMVVGKWLRGELKGQDGVPRFDKGKLQGADEVFKWNLGKDKGSYQDEVDRAVAETKEHYPILWEALTSIESGKDVLQQGWFYKGKDNVNSFKLTTEKESRKMDRTTFATRDEAKAYRDMIQDSAEFIDVLFEVVPVRKGRKKKGETDEREVGYQIKGTKDKLSKVDREWQAQLEEAVYTDWVMKSFPNDPKTAKYIKDISDVIRRTDVKGDELGKFFGKVVRTAMTDYKNGILWPAEKSEFHRLAKVVESFDNEVAASPEMLNWRNTLARVDVGVPEGTSTLDLMVYAIEKSYAEPGFLQELQQYAPKAWTDMAESFSNFAYALFKNEIQLDMRLRMENKPSKYSVKDYKLMPASMHGMAPIEAPGSMVGVDVAQMQDPTVFNAWLRSGNTRGKKDGNIMQRALLKGEQFFLGVFGNQIQNGESNTLFKVFGEATVREQSNTNYAGIDSIENLSFTGKEIDTPEGKRFVKDPHGERNDKAYLEVHADPYLHALADDVRRTAQKVRMTWEQMQNHKEGIDPEIDIEIDELKQHVERYQKQAGKKFDDKMEYLREFLVRSYSVNQTSNRHWVKNKRDYQTIVTAEALFKAAMNPDVRPEHAHEVSKALTRMMPPGDGTDPMVAQRVKLIQNITGWDQSEAFKFNQTWLSAHEKISQLGAMRESTPYYVNEQRHKRYTVPYVVKTKGEKGQSGMRDFEHIEQAEEFIKNASKEGLHVSVKFPKDSWRLKSRIKPFNDAMQNAIDHVVSSNAMMMEISLHGKVEKGQMKKEDAEAIVSRYKNLKGDIQMELAAENAGDMGHRFFKHGREHLDMTYQQIRGVWQDAIKGARDVTDATYRLYSEDPLRQANQAYMKRAMDAKDQLRMMDGEMQQKVSKASFTMFMLANPSTGAIEMMQFPISLSHILIENGGGVMDSFRIPLELARQAGKASMKRIGGVDDTNVWDNPHHIMLIREAERAGRMNIRNYMDNNENVQAERIKAYANLTDPGGNPVAKIAEGAYKAGATFYGAFNRFNAELSLTSAFETLKRKKYGKAKINDAQARELFERSMLIADIANGAHGRAGRPIWFNNRSEGMRTVAQLGWSLQSYAQSYIASWLRQITTSFAGEMKGKSKEEITAARKALTVQTTLQLGGLGLMGIPLVGGIAKAMQMAFRTNPEMELKEWLDEKWDLSAADNLALADAMLYGVQRATGSPLDIRSRLAVSGIGPLSEYEGFSMANFGGPLMGLASGLIANSRTVETGDNDFVRYSTGALPAGIQRGVRMMFFDNGEVFTKAGKFVMTPTTVETVGSFLGLSPTRYTDHVRATSMQNFAKELDTIEQTRAANAIADVMNEPFGEREAMRMLDEKSKELKVDAKVLANRVAKKSLERLYGPTIRQGTGQHAQTAARLYQSPLDRVPLAARETTRLSTLNKLGYLPKTWEKTLERAYEVDTLVGQTGMTESQARDNLMNSQQTMTSPMGLQGLVYGEELDQPLQ